MDEKISVIVPTYNAEKYLMHGINSIINQNFGFENIELILVDDNSKDNTPQKIKELSNEYPNVKIIFLEGKDLYYYNMFIAPKEVIAPYCDWVFPILAEVEKRVDMTGYDDYQKRIYGFLTERLFDVWMDKQNLRVKECELKVNGLRLNVHMWIVKRAIVRWAYIHIYMGLLHKDMRR